MKPLLGGSGWNQPITCASDGQSDWLAAWLIHNWFAGAMMLLTPMV